MIELDEYGLIKEPERYSKITGTSGTFQALEDQGWDDFCAILDSNYDPDIFGYFPVYFLWGLRGTSRLQEGFVKGTVYEGGEIRGKQVSGILVITERELILIAKKAISEKHPRYPPLFSVDGLFRLAISALGSKKTKDFSIHKKDAEFRLPMKGLRASIQAHKQLGNKIYLIHPTSEAILVDSLFTDGEAGVQALGRPHLHVQISTRQNRWR